MKQNLQMKQITIILILLAPLISESQLNTGAYFGYDTNGRGIAAWSVGCTIKHIVEIQGEIRPSLSRNVFAHNYMGGRIGLNLVNPDEDFLCVSLGAGYFYDLKSTDKKSLNNYYWGTYIKSVIMITENGGLGVDALYINNSAQFSVGIHYKFTRQRSLY